MSSGQDDNAAHVWCIAKGHARTPSTSGRRLQSHTAFHTQDRSPLICIVGQLREVNERGHAPDRGSERRKVALVVVWGNGGPTSANAVEILFVEDVVVV